MEATWSKVFYVEEPDELRLGSLPAQPMRGTATYWRNNLLRRYIKPATKTVGSPRTSVGTFRHSFGTLLKANGEDVKTVQELIAARKQQRITLDVYTQAVNSHKRAAQSKVVQMIVPNVGTNVGTSGKSA